MMPSTLRPKQQNTETKNLGNPLSLRPKQQQKQEVQEYPFENENDLERETERAQAQLTSRGLETIAGLPGDLESFGRYLFGNESETLLPTSEKLQGLSEKASLGYTKPKNEFEQQGGEAFKDFISMAVPGRGHYTFARNIGIPVVGNLLKEGMKYSGADEKSQAYGKVGTMLVLDLMSGNKGGVKKYMSDLFTKSEQSIPQGLSISASNLEPALNKLEKTLKMGGSRPSTKKSLEKIMEIKSEIKNGKIGAKELAAYRPSINEAIDELGGFQVDVPRKHIPKTIKNLNEVKNATIKSLEEYGEKFNPEFLKYSRSANEAWAAYSNSNKIVKFLQDKVPYAPKSKAVQALFSYGPITALGGLSTLSPGIAVGTAAAATGYQGFKIANRVLNSKTLRKYYGNILKESSAGNIASTSRNLKALDTLMDIDPDYQDRHNQVVEK